VTVLRNGIMVEKVVVPASAMGEQSLHFIKFGRIMTSNGYIVVSRSVYKMPSQQMLQQPRWFLLRDVSVPSLEAFARLKLCFQHFQHRWRRYISERKRLLLQTLRDDFKWPQSLLQYILIKKFYKTK